MTPPRHLWSGDWQRESAAAAEEHAKRRTPTEERPAAPSEPPRPSLAVRTLALIRSALILIRMALAHMRRDVGRAWARIRAHRPRRAVLMALAMLLSAAAGYAAVSLLVTNGDRASSTTGNPTFASSPARTASPAWLGVDTINFGLTNGVMVVDVVPGSPADAAGLQPGDIITQVGNRPVQSPTDLQSALAGMHPGQQVEIQYQRGLSSYTTRATLAPRPANGP